MKRIINTIVLAVGLVFTAMNASAVTPAECRDAWERSEAAQPGNWSWAGGKWTVERCDNVQVDVVRHQAADGEQRDMCRISARCTRGLEQEPAREMFIGPPERVKCLAHWPIGPFQGLKDDAC